MGSNVIAASEKEETSREFSLFRVASEPFRPVHWRANSLTGSWRFSPRTSPMWRVTNRVPIASIARPDDPILSFELPMAMTGLGQSKKSSYRA